MDINIHTTFLPHADKDAAIAFYCDALGFELRNDVGYHMQIDVQYTNLSGECTFSTGCGDDIIADFSGRGPSVFGTHPL